MTLFTLTPASEAMVLFWAMARIGLSEPGLLDEQVQPDHHHNGDRENEDVEPGEAEVGEVPGLFKARGKGFHGKRLGPGPPDEHGQVLQEDGHADGRDQTGQPGRLPQRPVGDHIEEHAADGPAEHGQEEGHPERHAQSHDKGHGKEGPQHVDLAVGEVDQLDHPVDHGVSHGDQGVDASDGQAVYELLYEQWVPRGSSR